MEDRRTDRLWRLRLTFGKDPSTLFRTCEEHNNNKKPPLFRSVASFNPSSSARKKPRLEKLTFYECPHCHVQLDMDNQQCNNYTHHAKLGGCGKSFCAMCARTGPNTNAIYGHLCWPGHGDKCRTKLKFPSHKCEGCIKFFCEGSEKCARAECTHEHLRPKKFKAISETTFYS